MYSLHFPSRHVAVLADAISSSADKARTKLPHGQAFADASYLHHVIAFLEFTRRKQGIGISELAEKASLGRGVIRRAERHGVIPGIQDFKAWATALGVKWDELWSICFPDLEAEGGDTIFPSHRH